MDQIQLHPTVYQETGMLVSESVRSMGGILVNAEGKRFCNDMSTRDAVSNAELEQPVRPPAVCTAATASAAMPCATSWCSAASPAATLPPTLPSNPTLLSSSFFFFG